MINKTLHQKEIFFSDTNLQNCLTSYQTPMVDWEEIDVNRT